MSQNPDSLVISNCNSIETARIEIWPGSLNIKYGPNGTGKTTVTKALALTVGGESLQSLHSFGTEEEPRVEVPAWARDVKVFDEQYVEAVLFRESELIEGSFDILFKTPVVTERESAVQDQLLELASEVYVDDRLRTAIAALRQVQEACKATKNGGLAKNSSMAKALASNAEVARVAVEHPEYVEYLDPESVRRWAAWHHDGVELLGTRTTCPLCAAQVPDPNRLSRVSGGFEGSALKHLEQILGGLDNWTGILADEARVQLLSLLGDSSSLTPEAERYLTQLASEAGEITGKLEQLTRRAAALGGLSVDLNDLSVEQLSGELQSLKPDLNAFPDFASDDLRELLEPVRARIDALVDITGPIVEEARARRAAFGSVASARNEEINSFLDSAGYSYRVVVHESTEGELPRIMLRHTAEDVPLNRPQDHLSFGERNALALLLFAYDVAANPGVIAVLDDPISSFDQTKSHALMIKLFGFGGLLAGRTSIMLTHELGPVIDILKAVPYQFDQKKVRAWFLRNDKGSLTEKRISVNDLRLFSRICQSRIESATHDFFKVAYVRLLKDLRGERDAVHDVVSNVIHVRRVPSYRGGRQIPAADWTTGLNGIRRFIPDFDYDALLAELADVGRLLAVYDGAQGTFEKLQVVRVGLAQGWIDQPPLVIKKFLDESLHVQGSRIMQLDPVEFDVVPPHVARYCGSAIEALRQREASGSG